MSPISCQNTLQRVCFSNIEISSSRCGKCPKNGIFMHFFVSFNTNLPIWFRYIDVCKFRFKYHSSIANVLARHDIHKVSKCSRRGRNSLFPIIDRPQYLRYKSVG
eukprot:285440_1